MQLGQGPVKKSKLYTYSDLKATNPTVNFTIGNTSDQTIKIPSGWMNFNKLAFQFVIQMAALADNYRVFHADCFSFIQSLRLRGSQSNQEYLNIPYSNYYSKVCNMYGKHKGKYNKFFFQKKKQNVRQIKSSTNDNHTQIHFLLDAQDQNSLQDLNNLYLQGDRIIKNQANNADIVLVNSVDGIADYQQQGMRQYTILEQTAVNQAVNTQVVIPLSEIYPFTIFDLDEDVWLSEELEMIITFAPAEQCVFSATVTAANAFNILANDNVFQTKNMFQTISTTNTGFSFTAFGLLLPKLFDDRQQLSIINSEGKAKSYLLDFPQIDALTTNHIQKDFSDNSYGQFMKCQLISFFPKTGVQNTHAQNFGNHLQYFNANQSSVCNTAADSANLAGIDMISNISLTVDTKQLIQNLSLDSYQMQHIFASNQDYGDLIEDYRMDDSTVQKYSTVIPLFYQDKNGIGKSTDYGPKLTIDITLGSSAASQFSTVQIYLISVFQKTLTYTQQGQLVVV